MAFFSVFGATLKFRSEQAAAQAEEKVEEEEKEKVEEEPVEEPVRERHPLVQIHPLPDKPKYEGGVSDLFGL